MTEFDDIFRVEESRELLLAIFPKYPDLRGCRPAPNPREFLADLRRRRAAEAEEKNRGTVETIPRG